MRLPPLTVIEASAGTGKTFALVTRLLQLIFAGTEPERIVALTFSRMAAGEIFNSFIERLSRAAADEKTAADESARLGRTLTAADFLAMLRKVIARQHLSLIGTLDSFLMRIVRMIPLELGLEGEVSVMSDFQSPVERLRLVGEMMMRESEDAKAVFRESFRLAYGTAGAKGFLESFAGFIESWHARYRDLPDAGAWGDRTAIWGEDVPDGLDVSPAEIRACAEELAPLVEKRGAPAFIKAVATFGGTLPNTFPVALQKEPFAQKAMRMMRRWKIAKALSRTQGVFLLMAAYEATYAAKVRARGRITFDDLPRLVNSLGADVRLPLEYRMDASFDHWALDEFQDTSRGQWRALSNLIDESVQRGEQKSVFIVGDRKQSIYEWRGGDVRILGEQAERAKATGNELVPLDESWRYLPAISRAVNAVFGEDVIRGVFDMDHAAEGSVWRCRTHVSHNTAEEGFVEVVQAQKARNQATAEDFFGPIEDALNAVKPWTRGISTAILVRKNTFGAKILGYLKSRGISRVVFEGESDISDSPVLAAMAELVKLAEHAGDAFSYAHIRCSPLAAALWPDGVPDENAMAAQLLGDFTRLGMVRMFRGVREALKSVPDSWNDFTESRFEDFIKCAAEFEEIRDASMRLSDFIEYLAHRTRRDYAEPGMVRIMTMHQSKGLGFDWVIVPFYEREGLVDETHLEPLTGEAPPWMLDNPGADVADSDTALAQAMNRWRQSQRYNALCLDYVAMTRAKKALTLILHPANKKTPTVPERFSDLVRLVGLQTHGDKEWYLKISPQTPQTPQTSRTPQTTRRRRETIAKIRPSETFYTGLTGDRLFADDFGSAARRGVELHAAYERIEWLDPSQAKTDFDRALVRPDAGATLWRERSYELWLDGKWETGCFDRVVFTGAGASRKAVICDFKTNALRPGESQTAFAARMRSTYAPQMAAYRRALSSLTGIPLRAVSATLLLQATGQAVEVVSQEMV